MPYKKRRVIETSDEPEKTFIKSLQPLGVSAGGDPSAVDVKRGRIVRIRPLHYDWKYTREEMKPWKIKRNGKVLEPPMKALLPPITLSYKKRVFSPNRIKYPLKRVDWDPNGERNTQNRGVSKYQRISWDEAADIIASEIKRIHEKYGPFGILAQGDGHGESKTVHACHGCQMLLLSKMGGYTLVVRNPDSWEGWYWGTKHVWGEGDMGMMFPQTNTLKDVSENSELLLFWGGDLETTTWGFGGQFSSRLLYFWSEAGIKEVYICPDLNYAAAIHADKWIPVLPNTDAAMQLAIIYTWITEGTYDKKYVATHTVGFDKVEDYVMGKEDGIPKTPAWASPKCGVPEWTIKALAREFAAKTTSTVHHLGGSFIRGPYSHEPARLEALLLGMQGLGKPGVHQFNVPFMIMPREKASPSTWPYPEKIQSAWRGWLWTALSKQMLPKTLIHKAILNPPPISWWSNASQFAASPEDQFVKYTYPISREEGGTEIHMIWADNPCLTTCWNNGNKEIEGFRSPQIECIVVQHPWLENDCVYADIILPVNTKLEEEDILGLVYGLPIRCLVHEKQCIEPIGESKSDYEVVCEVAKKLGLEEEYTEGRTTKEWVKIGFECTKVARAGLISWEELQEKQYYMVPPAEDWEKDSPGWRKFYEDPKNNPLGTPSGKLEFYSERIAKYFPDDKERPPIPKWIDKSVTHDERLSSERAKKYPLLIMSNHGRWRVHAQGDDISWTREAQTCKVRGPDGYMYEPLWMNPKDADKRGIMGGDIVKVYNERGTVLGGAYITERLRPGVAYMDHGSRCDSIISGELDRGGAINLISPDGIVSEHCPGQATSGYLVEVERVSMAQMEAWRQQYPEAFERGYDPASGLRFSAWVEGGSEAGA